MNKASKIQEVKELLAEYEKMIIMAIESGADKDLSSFELIVGAAQTGLLAAQLSTRGYDKDEIATMLTKISNELESQISKVESKDKKELEDLEMDVNGKTKKTFH